MKNVLIQRQAAAAGADLEFVFEIAGSMYLVKNFTEGDIYVGFSADDAKEDRALIPTECSQVFDLGRDASAAVYVLPDAAGDKGVEVDCIRW